MKIKATRSERIFDSVIIALLLLIAVITLYPIWYVLIASVSSPNAISAGEVLLWPVGFNVSAYERLLENKDIWIGYRNSIIYTSAATLVDLVVTIPCAFALSRKTLPHRKFFMTLFIITMYFNGGVIPKYLVVNQLGLVNTPWALILPGCVNVFNLIVARNYFESNISDTLLEAAQIDGASYTHFFLRIALPLSGAIIAVIALYCIQAHWNAYLGAQMYIYSRDLRTLQQVIRDITATLDSTLTSDTATTQEIMKAIQEKQLAKYAVVVVSCLPLVIVYPFVQKFFVKGVMVGSVKG